MSDDGRRGEVFTLRLLATDRRIIEEAIQIEATRSFRWRRAGVGPWMVGLAVQRARAVIAERDQAQREKAGAAKAVRKAEKQARRDGRRGAVLERGNTDDQVDRGNTALEVDAERQRDPEYTGEGGR